MLMKEYRERHEMIRDEIVAGLMKEGMTKMLLPYKLKTTAEIDHMIQGDTLLGPLSSAVILKLDGKNKMV